MTAWYETKQFLQHSSTVSMDALHVLAGATALVGLSLLLRRPVSSWLPLLIVFVLALINEAVDLWVEQWPEPAMQYGESAKDLVLTMLLPTLTLITARQWPWLYDARQAPPRSMAAEKLEDGRPTKRCPESADAVRPACSPDPAATGAGSDGS